MVSVRRVAPILLLVAVPRYGAAKRRLLIASAASAHRAGDHWTTQPSRPASTARRQDVHHQAGHPGAGAAVLQQRLSLAAAQESNTWLRMRTGFIPVTCSSSVRPRRRSAPLRGDHSAVGSVPAARQPLPNQVIAGGRGDGNPVPLGTEADVCASATCDPNEPMPNRVGSYETSRRSGEVGAMKQEIGGSNNDLSTSTAARTGLVAGETYLVVEPGDMVTHPGRWNVGRHWEYRGQIRVLCADEHFARGIVTESCMDIHIGARLKPSRRFPPLARIPDVPAFCDPPAARRRGTSSTRKAAGAAPGVRHPSRDQPRPRRLGAAGRLSPPSGATALSPASQVIGESASTTEAHTATARIVGFALPHDHRRSRPTTVALARPLAALLAAESSILRGLAVLESRAGRVHGSAVRLPAHNRQVPGSNPGGPTIEAHSKHDDARSQANGEEMRPCTTFRPERLFIHGGQVNHEVEKLWELNGPDTDRRP